MSTAPDEPWSNAPGWRAFFDLLTDAVVLFDARGRVAIANTAALRLLPFEVGMQPDALRPVIGVDASAWLKRTVTRGAVAEPLPAARSADGRSAALTWQRLDARHSVLRIVPDPIPPARATTLPAVGGAGVRETLSLFWESPFPASLQGADFRMLDVNQALLDYTGYTREQLIGQDPRTLQPDDDHLLNDAARERLRASFGHAREPALQAGRLIDASGRERHYRVARRALQGDDGEPLYLAVLQDATAEHVARERADRSLRELDDWFDLNPVGMVLFDDTGLLLRTNPIFDALTGVVPVALSDAPAGLQQLLAWGGTAVLPQLTPGGVALQREGSVSGARGEEQPLRSVVRCYLAAGGQRRYMAVLEDRSAEEERDLAQMQIGALMDTAGVGLATFEVLKKVHEYGGVVFHDVISIRHAQKALEAGVDGLILVCAGAGGHAGALSPFALLREVRKFFSGPIALSGSITDGAGILAAEAMGADFAYIGTRFIATREANAAQEYKQMIVESKAADVVYTPFFTGVHGNYLKPSIVRAGLDPDNLAPVDKTSMNFGSDRPVKAWKDIWGVGQGIGNIDDVPPVGELIARLRSEYDAARSRLEITA